jgi:hypothetical protein
MWFLKSQFDHNSIMINYKLNDDFKSHIIIEKIQERFI